MAEPQIQPHRITKPIQLLAVLMAGLILLVGSLLGGARFLDQSGWISGFLAISAVVSVPLFLIFLFLLLTRFRPQLQEDSYYLKWLRQEQKFFVDFSPENLESPSTQNQLPTGGSQDLEEQRIRCYQEYHGVFLVHSWRPSTRLGQLADVVLRLQQHSNGPLSSGEIVCVEYALGPKFFPRPVTKRNRNQHFRLEVSAYGPMLCLARVRLANGSSFVLQRYVDFETAE